VDLKKEYVEEVPLWKYPTIKNATHPNHKLFKFIKRLHETTATRV
jgi:hypothetical protein